MRYYSHMNTANSDQFKRQFRFITPTATSSFIFILGAIGIFILGIATGFFLSYAQEKKPVTISSQLTPTPKEQQIPEKISEKKNIKLGNQSPEIGIQFEGIEKTTYDEIEYLYRNNKYIRLGFHLPHKEFSGVGQKIGGYSSYDGSYLVSMYEGTFLKPLNILHAQLEQSPGYYPATIYDGAYEIFINKNGVRMKKKYVMVPGYLFYTIELITPTPAASRAYPNRYYSFNSSIFIPGEKYDTTTLSKNPQIWVKNNYISEFIALDTFVESIRAK